MLFMKARAFGTISVFIFLSSIFLSVFGIHQLVTVRKLTSFRPMFTHCILFRVVCFRNRRSWVSYRSRPSLIAEIHSEVSGEITISFFCRYSPPSPITGNAETRNRAAPIGIRVTSSTAPADFTGLR
jgi:hypothetical protein